MGLTEDLIAEVNARFHAGWSVRQGEIVPEPEALLLGNDVVRLRAVVLYADLVGSTALVDGFRDWFAAHMYKAFLLCAARIIKSEGGAITAYDGDRVMAVYLGDDMATAAARTALKIDYAVKQIINPATAAGWPPPLHTKYDVRHVTGIDVSDLFIARVGVRNDNDLAWIGRAANHGAKLASLREGTYSTYVSKEVYDALELPLKYTNGVSMWESRIWTGFDGSTIYRSNWHWGSA